MSREHFLIKLTSNAKETLDQPVHIFIDSIVAMWPLKDNTCLVITDIGEFPVKEAAEAVIQKAKSYNVISELP